jgi:hypothetical protein
MSKSGTPSSPLPGGRASEAAVRLQLIFQVKGNQLTYAIVFGGKSISEFGWLRVTGNPEVNFSIADHPPRIVGLTTTASRRYNLAHGWALPLARNSDLMKFNHR